MLSHQLVQGALARVSERRMSKVVDERERLDKVHIQIESRSDGARDLRDLDGVRQARAEVVRVAAGEDLGLVLQAAERARVNYAVAVTLEGIAVGMRRLRIAAPAGILRAHRVAGEHKRSVAGKIQRRCRGSA